MIGEGPEVYDLTLASFRKLLPVFLPLIFLAFLQPVMGQTVYDIQVGAWGDDASRGNMGVGVEIRTSIFPRASQDSFDYFWVGDNLQNGAFIQFGYGIVTPRYYCLYGESAGYHNTCFGSSDNVGNGDVRWFWEYWPNGEVNDFYYGVGPMDSVGPEGSWHLYQIRPNVANGWKFVLDGQSVQSFNDFRVQESNDKAYFVAEEVTDIPSASGTLGPVEFRNLSYLTTNGWVQVQSLTAISGCGALTPNCGISIPYGVTVLGANDVRAGTGEQLRETDDLLWLQTFALTVSVPTGVQVTVDGTTYTSGVFELSLSSGPHTISVSNFFQVDAGNGLRFAKWSDGVAYNPRTIDLSSDTSLEATYVKQYKLTLVSSSSTSGDGWYDKGTTAKFHTDSTPRILNLGIMFPVGWYSETGQLITIFGSGSIVMDAPHTLTARWVRLDFLILTAIVVLGIIVIDRGLSRLRGNQKPRQTSKGTKRSQTTAEPSVEHVSAPLPQAPKRTRGQSEMFCFQCGAVIPRDSKFCKECGSKQT
jgi:ribosomal protein L40E